MWPKGTTTETREEAHGQLPSPQGEAVKRVRGKERPTASLSSLLDGLQSCVLPLLRQHSDFFPKAERLELSHSYVRGIVSVNIHGGSTARTGCWVGTPTSTLQFQ